MARAIPRRPARRPAGRLRRPRGSLRGPGVGRARVHRRPAEPRRVSGSARPARRARLPHRRGCGHARRDPGVGQRRAAAGQGDASRAHAGGRARSLAEAGLASRARARRALRDRSRERRCGRGRRPADRRRPAHDAAAAARVPGHDAIAAFLRHRAELRGGALRVVPTRANPSPRSRATCPTRTPPSPAPTE